jgi:hypothetical protein
MRRRQTHRFPDHAALHILVLLDTFKSFCSVHAHHGKIDETLNVKSPITLDL